MITSLAAVTNDDGSLTHEWGIAAIIVLAALLLLLLVLVLCALFGILTTSALSVGAKVIWIVAVLVFPLLGSLVWFVWSRKTRLPRGGLSSGARPHAAVR